jgi:4-hydroxybenzoate polyprenyltransferase
MKTIRAFFTLIRLGNLLFIAGTQILFYRFVFGTIAGMQSFKPVTDSSFLLLIAASVFIAAGGYVINDYFDVQIDQVNRPNQVVVDRQIKRRNAIILHALLSMVGIACTFWVARATGKWSLLLFNLLSVLLLWVYSAKYKKTLLVGNIMIALLTAWVILAVYWFAGKGWDSNYVWLNDDLHYDVKKLFKYAMTYAGFAFIMTLIREVVKDLEDMQGDAQFGCKTMPIVWGVPVAKMFAGVWMSVATAGLIVLSLYAWQSGVQALTVYMLITLVTPLLISIRQLKQAQQVRDYHQLSSMIKWIMLAGILSMIFFYA